MIWSFQDVSLWDQYLHTDSWKNKSLVRYEVILDEVVIFQEDVALISAIAGNKDNQEKEIHHFSKGKKVISALEGKE